MKSLLIFSPHFYPYVGGLESHVEEFAKHISEHDFNVVIFTSRFATEAPPDEQRYKNVRIIRYPAFQIVPNFPCPKFWSKEFWKQWSLIKKMKFDFQMTRTRFFLTSLLPFFYGRKKAKWIHVEHGSSYVQLSNRLKNLIGFMYDNILGRLILLTADEVVVISKSVESFVTKFTNRPTHLIYRGMDLVKLDCTIKDQIKLDESRIKIGVACRLYKWKGVENSINAVLSIPRNDIVFYIAGNGEDFAHLKEYESDKIRLLGELSRNEAISFLKKLDIYIHSSYAGGGLSCALLEAMYCENVVIATPNEGANEVVNNGKTGILVKESSEDAIKQGIEQVLLEKDKWPTYRENAHKFIGDNFIWNKAIERYLKILV